MPGTLFTQVPGTVLVSGTVPVSDTVLTYTHDPLGRLTQVGKVSGTGTVPDTILSCSYDGEGKRA